MKAKIEQPILNAAIESAMSAISNKPINPIIGCIIIEANHEENTLTIKSTNVTSSIYQIIDAEVDEKGVVAVSAQTLKKTIASLKGELNLSLGNGYLTIVHETGQCRLTVNEYIDEFPDIAEHTVNSEYSTVVISTKKLQVVLDNVLYAASNDEAKMIICGVNFKTNNDKLIVATTDGHRMARVCVALNESSDINFTAPAKVLAEISKILRIAPENSDCVINVYTNIVTITMPGIKIFSRLLDGEYPAIDKLIPNSFTSEFTIERKAFLETLKRVQNLADKKDKAVAILWDADSCKATVLTESNNLGDAYDEIHMKPQTELKENSTIGFNIDYLTETINSIATDEIVIKCNEPLQPVIVNPIGGLLEQLNLIMPLQIKMSDKPNINQTNDSSQEIKKETIKKTPNSSKKTRTRKQPVTAYKQ